jgi:hypothetical protein
MRYYRSQIPALLVFALLLTGLSACGPSLAPTGVSAPTEAAQREFAPQLLATPTLEPAETSTPVPFVFEFTPVASETALPTLELSTSMPNPPFLQVWDGLPTYPAESRPGFYFRLRFDPDLWGLTSDNFGFPAIGHRSIPSCVIVPASGHGLPPSMVVDHDQRRLGTLAYNVNTAYSNGVAQFVTYQGGDANIFTGFEVRFEQQMTACLQDAETVLSTLTSVPVSQATPAPPQP